MFAPSDAVLDVVSSADLNSPELLASLRGLVRGDQRPDRERRVVLRLPEGQPVEVPEPLRALAALHPGMALELRQGDEALVVCAPTGLPGLLGARLVGAAGRLPGVARFTASAPCEGGEGELRAEVALQWLLEGEGQVSSYVNDEPTPGHGTPLLGFVAGLSKALEEEGLERDLLHYGMPALTKRRVLTGVAAILKLEHPSPLYSSPARTALSSRDALPLFEQLARRAVRGLVRENEGLIEALLTRALGMPVCKTTREPLHRRPNEPLFLAPHTEVRGMPAASGPWALESPASRDCLRRERSAGSAGSIRSPAKPGFRQPTGWRPEACPALQCGARFARLAAHAATAASAANAAPGVARCPGAEHEHDLRTSWPNPTW